MERIEIDQLPGYPTKKTAPLTIDEDGNYTDGTLCYPIPDFEIVSDQSITIMEKSFSQLDSKLSMKILHFLYGPEFLSFNVMHRGESIPRLFFKEQVKNNWIACDHYGKPITLFTINSNGLNFDITDQLIFKHTNVVDLQHPYCQRIFDVGKTMEIEKWPQVTMEMYIRETRKGDLILGQIQLYEIDLDMKYYLEVDDITPFTAYQLTK